MREAVKSTLSVQPVKSERKHKGGRKNAVMNEADYEPDESLEENGSDKEAVFTNNGETKNSSDTEVPLTTLMMKKC